MKLSLISLVGVVIVSLLFVLVWGEPSSSSPSSLSSLSAPTPTTPTRTTPSSQLESISEGTIDDHDGDMEGIDGDDFDLHGEEADHSHAIIHNPFLIDTDTDTDTDTAHTASDMSDMNSEADAERWSDGDEVDQIDELDRSDRERDRQDPQQQRSSFSHGGGGGGRGRRCRSSRQCRRGQFCSHRNRCGRGSARRGICIRRPYSCPRMGRPRWVCGCNKRNYRSRCHASKAGASVRHNGRCRGGWSGGGGGRSSFDADPNVSANTDVEAMSSSSPATTLNDAVNTANAHAESE